MSSRTERLLVVVSVLEGRHFPKIPRLSLVVQVSFNGEYLFTDPVEHREQPQFNTELAWELDRRTLHQHRLQRTPIKLQCFTVDSVSQKRESVGYVVLDLRSVQEVRQEPRWFPLLSSKYTKQRPALLLGTTLENDTKAPQPSPDRFRAKEAPPRQGSPSGPDLVSDQLEAILVSDQGYHQVGPPDLCTDMFVLSVTVAFASSLEHLIPPTMKLSSEDSGFFFYYSLLGNDITSEPFYNLLSPDFQPERASVRIRSRKQVLQAFLSQQPSLQVHLCCGNQSLGSTDVSFSALAAVSMDVEKKVLTVEGAFVLTPPKRVQLLSLPADLQPTVGVAITLRREELLLQQPNVSEAPLPAAPQRPQRFSAARRPPDLPPSTHTESEADSLEEIQLHRDQTAASEEGVVHSCPPAASEDMVIHSCPPAASEDMVIHSCPPAASEDGVVHSHPPAASEDGVVHSRPPAASEDGVVHSRPSAASEDGVVRSRPPAASEDRVVRSRPPADVKAPAQLSGGPEASISVSIPSSAHHYCFSLDLRSLRKLSLPHPVAATLRYSYQFFGSSAPIMTNPPVELQRNMEVSLPQSYCAFDFAAMPHQLQDTFLRVPLEVQLWHRNSTSRDQLIGRASIKLSHLLNSDRIRFTGSTGEQSWRQSYRDWIAVVQTQSPREKVAELSYVATLEDHGFIRSRQILISDSSQNEVPAETTPAAPHPAETTPAAPHPAETTPAAPRETLEYRMALELELWKEQQEDLFDDQLKKKEFRHMQALAEEWKKRDGEREALVKKKEVEYNLLEEQLLKTLSDLEKREKQLAEAELQTQQLQRELRADHQLAQKELQDSIRRLQRECDHRVALEREKVHLMEEERTRLLQQISDGESRYKQLEREFQMFREQHSSRPELRLQSEINLLMLEKVEMERKLESTIKSKLHYKQQWGRTLKELARFKQREQENAMARLKKQQAELEAIRLRYLATEEKEAVRQDRRELDDIRNEINRLKKQEEKVDHTPSRPDPAPSLSVNESAEEHLCRLLEERDTLLRTGVYTHEDRIITELNRQIQDAMRDRSRTP